MSISALARIQSAEPLISVELRPPRTDLSAAASMDIWIDMYHAIQRLTRQDALIPNDDARFAYNWQYSIECLVVRNGTRRE